MAYLNHAGTSWPKPEPVRQAVAEALAGPPNTWASRLEQDHRAVCDAFGVSDPSRLLLTPGATSALSIAVADHPWQRGDRVIISGMEHHALHRPVQLLAHRGVEIVVVPRDGDSPFAVESLRNELRRGSVRLVAVTAASNVTGDLLPIDDITGLAREYGALSLIDAAQIAGWMELKLDASGADLVAFTGHKGPQAPWGIGGLYVAPSVAMASPSAACEMPTGGDTAPCAPMPGYCDVGSVDRAALAGLVAGLDWLAQPERRDRLVRARARVSRLAQAVLEIPEVTLHGHADPNRRMPTLALTVDGCSPGEMASRLEQHGVTASAGLQCAPLAHETLGTAPEGVLRFSVGPTTADQDIEAVIYAWRQCMNGVQ